MDLSEHRSWTMYTSDHHVQYRLQSIIHSLWSRRSQSHDFFPAFSHHFPMESHPETGEAKAHPSPPCCWVAGRCLHPDCGAEACSRGHGQMAGGSLISHRFWESNVAINGRSSGSFFSGLVRRCSIFLAIFCRLQKGYPLTHRPYIWWVPAIRGPEMAIESNGPFT